MSLIVTPQQVSEWLIQKEVTIIDVRSDLQNPEIGEAAYRKDHLPNAFYLHLERDLSGEIKQHGGNHPLPPLDTFSKKLQKMGIEANNPIVIYDTSNDMFASRAWWLIHALGHKHVYVLDGGYRAWVKAGFKVTNALPDEATSQWVANDPSEYIASMQEVRDRNKEKTILIDSRAMERYIGDKEPLYEKAGHIPGAINYFWKDTLQEDGTWKTMKQLETHFAALDKEADIIVSCGSGISACPNYIGLKLAGYKHIRLYPGSFSDWISYEENEVIKGAE